MRHAEPVVRGYAVTHPPGEVRLPTQLGWSAVLYAVSGVMTATTADESWLVPPERALWMGDGVGVAVRTHRRTAVRCLYLHRDVHTGSDGVRVVAVPPLLRELLLDTVARCPLEPGDPVDAATTTLLLHHLDRQEPVRLRVAMPSDDRARAFADSVLDDPAAPIADLVAAAGASRRTLERRFAAETGMTLAGWQRRARMVAAVRMLVEGTTVTATAVRVGYTTPSAFAVAFRSELGSSPRSFVGRVQPPEPSTERSAVRRPVGRRSCRSSGVPGGGP